MKNKNAYPKQLAKFETLINEFIDAINTCNPTKLETVTVTKSSTSKSLKTRRLTDKTISPIEGTKFHYSNEKTKD
jgi:hypothetical protein